MGVVHLSGYSDSGRLLLTELSLHPFNIATLEQIETQSDGPFALKKKKKKKKKKKSIQYLSYPRYIESIHSWCVG